MAQAAVELKKNTFCLRTKTIATKEAIEILENEDGASTSMPFRPKGGEVYLVSGNKSTCADYKADGHLW